MLNHLLFAYLGGMLAISYPVFGEGRYMYKKAYIFGNRPKLWKFILCGIGNCILWPLTPIKMLLDKKNKD
jgi:hypothetical protein